MPRQPTQSTRHRTHSSRNRSRSPRRPVKDVSGSARWYRRDDDLLGLFEAPSDEDESFYGPIPKQQIKASGMMRNGYRIPSPSTKWYPFSSKDEYHHARLLLKDVEVYGADGSLERGPLRKRGIDSYLGLMMAVGGGRDFKAFRSARQLYALMKRTGFRFPEKELTEDEMTDSEQEESDYSESDEEISASPSQRETDATESQDSDLLSEFAGTEVKEINWLEKILNEGNYLDGSDEDDISEGSGIEEDTEEAEEDDHEDEVIDEEVALDVSGDDGDEGDDADDESEGSLYQEDEEASEEEWL
jgi:hypothetical protein